MMQSTYSVSAYDNPTVTSPVRGESPRCSDAIPDLVDRRIATTGVQSFQFALKVSLLLLLTLSRSSLLAIEISTGKMLGAKFDQRSFYVREGPGQWTKTYTGSSIRGRCFPCASPPPNAARLEPAPSRKTCGPSKSLSCACAR